MVEPAVEVRRRVAPREARLVERVEARLEGRLDLERGVREEVGAHGAVEARHEGARRGVVREAFQHTTRSLGKRG